MVAGVVLADAVELVSVEIAGDVPVSAGADVAAVEASTDGEVEDVSLGNAAGVSSLTSCPSAGFPTITVRITLA